MIKSKNSLEELLKDMKSFTYYKDSTEIDVELKEQDEIAIRQNAPSYIEINFFEYDKALSTLYKDRKYINQCVFS